MSSPRLGRWCPRVWVGPKQAPRAWRKAVHDLLPRYNYLEAKRASTPLDPGLKLRAEEGTFLDDSLQYSALVGSMLYISVCTRPDIVQAVGALSITIT